MSLTTTFDLESGKTKKSLFVCSKTTKVIWFLSLLLVGAILLISYLVYENYFDNSEPPYYLYPPPYPPSQPAPSPERPPSIIDKSEHAYVDTTPATKISNEPEKENDFASEWEYAVNYQDVPVPVEEYPTETRNYDEDFEIQPHEIVHLARANVPDEEDDGENILVSSTEVPTKATPKKIIEKRIKKTTSTTEMTTAGAATTDMIPEKITTILEETTIPKNFDSGDVIFEYFELTQKPPEVRNLEYEYFPVVTHTPDESSEEDEISLVWDSNSTSLILPESDDDEAIVTIRAIEDEFVKTTPNVIFEYYEVTQKPAEIRNVEYFPAVTSDDGSGEVEMSLEWDPNSTSLILSDSEDIDEFNGEAVTYNFHADEFVEIVTLPAVADNSTIANLIDVPEASTLPPPVITYREFVDDADDEEDPKPKIIKTSKKIVHTCKMKNVCESAECKNFASDVLAKMDHSVNPCDNFYGYACGRFNKEPKNLIDSIDYANLDSSSNVLSSFYESCLKFDERNFGPIKNFLKELNSNETDLTKEEELADFLSEIILGNVNRVSNMIVPSFDLELDIGSDGKFMPVLKFSKENFVENPYEEICLRKSNRKMENETDVNSIYDNFLKCMQNSTIYRDNVIKAIETFELADEFSDIEEIFRVQENFIEDIENLSNLLHSQYKTEKYLTVDELIAKYPQVDWNRFFNKLFDGKETEISRLKILNDDGYFDNVFEFYQNHSVETIKQVILSHISHNLYLNFVKPQIDRPNYCKNLVAKSLPDLVVASYLSKFNSTQLENAETKIKEIFELLKQQLKMSINQAPAFSNSEIALIQSKIDQMELWMPFKDSTEFSRKVYNITDWGDFLTNILILQKSRKQEVYSLLGEQVDSKKIAKSDIFDALGNKPKTLTNINRIVAPFNFLESTELHNKDMEHFSDIPFELSKEIFSFFNPTEIDSALKANKNYVRFVDGLNEPPISTAKNTWALNLEGMLNRSLNLRFSDDAALWLSFEFLTENWSEPLKIPFLQINNRKMFYLLRAQNFCSKKISKVEMAKWLMESNDLPSELKVNSMLMNTASYPPYFSSQFECTNGSPMNPSTKSSHFPFIQNYNFVET